MKIADIISKGMILSLCIVTALSCKGGAGISGTLKDAPDHKLVVKLLDVNRYIDLDTVVTDRKGGFSYRVEVRKGQPEFVYLFSGDTKVASLLLQKGDKVKVQADTMGNYSVSGSDECERLLSVEKDYADFLNAENSLVSRIGNYPEGSQQRAELSKDITKEYVAYYRGRVKYILTNSKSLTVVPVLFQTFAGVPVFNSNTDALHFRNEADSLEQVYPDSKYVKALRAEATRREGLLDLSTRISSAEEVGFPDIELPDVNGVKKKLSEVDAKVIMLYFWTASEDIQKMLNMDLLKGLYEDYHSKGFEIYQISLDIDKAGWAGTVKSQNLEWINVCDSRGQASPYLSLYNVYSIPTVFIIRDGQLINESFDANEASLRKAIEKGL